MATRFISMVSVKFQVSLLISVTNNLNHTSALTASKIRIQARCDPSEDPGELEYDHVVASSAGIGEEGCACFVEAAVCLSVHESVEEFRVQVCPEIYLTFG